MRRTKKKPKKILKIENLLPDSKFQFLRSRTVLQNDDKLGISKKSLIDYFFSLISRRPARRTGIAKNNPIPTQEPTKEAEEACVKLATQPP